MFYYKDYIQPMIMKFMDHHIYHKGQIKIMKNIMLVMKMTLKTVMMMILMRTMMKVLTQFSQPSSLSDIQNTTEF